ncbi:MAG: hypothetical protein R2729_27015 [Bryobacteraceae bacterium]
MHFRRLPVALLLASAMSTAAELPIKKVVLYKNGVGYFERGAQLAAGETARLEFAADDMNDVLKSLTVTITGPGGVRSVRYDSQEPVERKLEKFPIKLADKAPLASLLDQLKGATLELKRESQPITGVIISARVIPATQQSKESEEVTLLLDSGDIRSFDVAAFQSIRFPDVRLQQQLKDYLGVLTQARSTGKRGVLIESGTEGSRDVKASYMIPTAVWKSSYRLVYPASGEPTIEGWAVVDNTSGDDWNNVSLAVVSGRPISFISELYEPKYVERPHAELPEDRPVGPVLHEAAFAKSAPPPPPAPALAARRGSALGGVIGGIVPAAEVAAPMADMSTVAAQAEAKEAGELFEYHFSQPVTVRKNESAMLPFLQQKLPARKLLIYSNESTVNPTNAVEITNNTGKTLDGGPVTVYDAGSYAGEALTETVKTGDKRLLSYGVDLGARVTTKFESSREVVREIHLRRGVITTRAAIAEKKNYTIKNVDAKAKTLIIEHPARYMYTLLAPAKPSEKTASAYRFEVSVGAAAEQTFVIDEERLLDRTYAVTNVNNDFLATLIQNKNLSAQGRQGLEQIIAKKREIADNDRVIAQAEQDSRELAADQQRVRENINTLSRVPGQQEQVNRYSQQLATIESQLAGLRDKTAEARKRKAALESELNSLIEKLEF